MTTATSCYLKKANGRVGRATVRDGIADAGHRSAVVCI